MRLKTPRLPLAFALIFTAMLSAPTFAAERIAKVSAPNACAKENFRGKNVKARIQACIDTLQKKKQAQEQQHREEIEGLRIELRDHCAQSPHTCDSATARMKEKLENGLRESHTEGQSLD